MKFLLYSFFAMLFISLLSFSQQPTVIVHDPPIPYTGNMGDWGTDLIVSNNEPFGKVSGIVRANDSIFVAMPDTVGIVGGGLRILKSINNGATWSQGISISNAGIVTKTRMVRSGLDTVYCIFSLASSQVYVLRVNLPFANPLRVVFTGGYRDFDAWSSSTGGLYIFLDSLGTNNIPRLASTDGGVTWSQRALVTSAGAHPFTVKSGVGDTAILMYYQAPTGDTISSAITVARYRESAPGTLASINFLTGLVPAGPQKDQFGAAWHSGIAWVFNTTGASGSRDIVYRVSTNSGAAFGTETPLANRPGVDEYWFDLKHYSLGAGGLDVIYYYDSTSGPNNVSDKILYTNATVGAPSTFSAALQISEHAPQFSILGYMPFLIEYYNTGGDVAAVWVGLDASNRRLYFDRLLAPVGVSQNQNGVPEIYSLSQNYPNPFNPATKIEFAIPKDGFVNLRVYDVLGKEVALLISSEFKAGSYTLDFDASKLPSGIYFYKLSSGGFSETKKMILIK